MALPLATMDAAVAAAVDRQPSNDVTEGDAFWKLGESCRSKKGFVTATPEDLLEILGWFERGAKAVIAWLFRATRVTKRLTSLIFLTNALDEKEEKIKATNNHNRLQFRQLSSTALVSGVVLSKCDDEEKRNILE
jgi:hypothetical protein